MASIILCRDISDQYHCVGTLVASSTLCRKKGGWGFVLAVVLCVAYSAVITTWVLCPVWFTEQCLLLELCAHDCFLGGLQNNAYSWSFVLCVVYRTVFTPGALFS